MIAEEYLGRSRLFRRLKNGSHGQFIELFAARLIKDELAQQGAWRCLSLVGRTTLRQLLVLYGLAEVLVTNDSGPAHFAALTDIDTVVLFGPETPLLFAARGPRNHVLWAGIACSPCINALNNRQTACRDNVCMKTITVGKVFNEVARVYQVRTQESR